MGKKCRLDRRFAAECCQKTGGRFWLGAKSSPNDFRQANPLTSKPRGETDYQDTRHTLTYHTVLVSTLAVSRAENPPRGTTPAISSISTRSPHAAPGFRTAKVQFSCRPRRLYIARVRALVPPTAAIVLHLIDIASENYGLLLYSSDTSGMLTTKLQIFSMLVQ